MSPPSEMLREEREEREESRSGGLSGTSQLSEVAGKLGKKSVILSAKSPHDAPPAEPDEPKVKRPGYATHDDWFKMHGRPFKPGLYWHGEKDDEPVDTWIATPIHADAITRDDAGGSWGLLLRFLNADGRWREWAAPMYLLKGSGEELRGELLHYGLRFNPRQKALLVDWMMGQQPHARVIAATRTGWHTKGRAFVLPAHTVGNEPVRFQSETAQAGRFGEGGTPEQWREQVGVLCKGNPLLILAVSLALAGPLLLRAKQQEQGGAAVHYVGDSSQGKSTALQVAASVWGPPGFVGTWRATSNGLEGAAAGQNDTVLILDELSECDPREAGAIVYLLGNGTGKQRAGRTGAARETARWRVMCLSSGERTLGAHMSEGGRQPNAGQEARLLDLPATDRAYGLFDELHGWEDGRAFADELKQVTAANFGHAGPAFVEHLITENKNLPELYAATLALTGFRTADGLESRAAGWFALIGMAGELATEYGITGWEPKQALAAAVEGFKWWRGYRGKGQTESRRILEGVTQFLHSYGDSRFTELNDVNPPKAANRAGWFRDDGDGRVYLFNTAALQEAAKGFDIRRIGAALTDAGWLVEHDQGRRTKKIYVSARQENFNLYAVRPGDDL